MNIPDGDHVLTQDAGWFDVSGFTVRIMTANEGVVVDIYDGVVAKTGDFDAALMASTYVYMSDLAVNQEENNEPDDLFADGDALASAGHGTDEDYGSPEDML